MKTQFVINLEEDLCEAIDTVKTWKKFKSSSDSLNNILRRFFANNSLEQKETDLKPLTFIKCYTLDAENISMLKVVANQTSYTKQEIVRKALEYFRQLAVEEGEVGKLGLKDEPAYDYDNPVF